MKTQYPSFKANLCAICKAKTNVFFAALFLISLSTTSYAQELVFKNPVLVSGSIATNDAVFRFPTVTDNVDALVTMNGRSDEFVSLVDIDLANLGHDNAFQPQVSYNNGTTPDGNSNWWMEFKISFVQTNTNIETTVNSFNVTALDVDGNNDKINEHVTFYGLKSFTYEQSTVLQDSSILQSPGGEIIGKKFIGPVTNFLNIDTTATSVMVTCKYENTSSLIIRAGGSSTGASGASDRMNSFWFKSFNYQIPTLTALPIILSSFTVSAKNDKAMLDWVTSYEKNSSHFVIEKSTDGINYTDIAMIFTEGNSSTNQHYQYADKISSTTQGIIYYRLRMVDKDAKFTYSPVKALRFGISNQITTISVYPNPAVNELRITIPSQWQNSTVSYQLFNMNGQIVKQLNNSQPSQTELMNMSDVKPGSYVLRVSNGAEIATQKIIKAN